ncbi:MAG: hypothetical protein H7836_02070 [Magnetococcus sp. YQC-3]
MASCPVCAGKAAGQEQTPRSTMNMESCHDFSIDCRDKKNCPPPTCEADEASYLMGVVATFTVINKGKKQFNANGGKNVCSRQL